MKKIFFISNGAWLLMAILFFANAMKKPDTHPAAVQPTPPPDCTSEQFYGVNPDKFVKGLARYRKYHWNTINKNLGANLTGGNQDARSCWYSIDTLKKFICQLEMYAESRPLGFKSGQLGIRFYYAAYDEREFIPYTFLDVHNTHPGLDTMHQSLGFRHTLFMVPTFASPDGSGEVDFDPRASSGLTLEQIGSGNTGIDPVTRPTVEQLSLWNNYVANPRKPFFILAPTTFNPNIASPFFIPSAKNQGMLCPPTCPQSETKLLQGVDGKFSDGTNF